MNKHNETQNTKTQNTDSVESIETVELESVTGGCAHCGCAPVAAPKVRFTARLSARFQA